jgi:hypothetical protein
VLMPCYVTLGQYGRAAHHYELFRRALKEKYGAGPSQETCTFFGTILESLDSRYSANCAEFGSFDRRLTSN